MPQFAPLRVRGGRHRLRRALRRRRRAMAAGLAMTAAALAASGAGGLADTGAPRAAAAPQQERKPMEWVSAPVRIADGATVRLLRPGDRVDVIAAPDPASGEGTKARVVAGGVRVAEVPRAPEASAEGGALVVLSVPRATAAVLAGAGATSRLAVTLC